MRERGHRLEELIKKQEGVFNDGLARQKVGRRRGETRRAMRDATSKTMTKAAPRFRLMKKQPAPEAKGGGKGRCPNDLGKWKHRGGLHALQRKFRVSGKQARQRLWLGNDRVVWGCRRGKIFQEGDPPKK